MTAQEVFDTVCKHLAQQKCRAVDLRASCKYRTADGRRCAAGCLIPDDEYFLGMEGKTVPLMYADGLLDELPITKALMDEHLELVSNLQAAHDYCLADTIQSELVSIAVKHGLDDATARLVTEWSRE